MTSAKHGLAESGLFLCASTADDPNQNFAWLRQNDSKTLLHAPHRTRGFSNFVVHFEVDAVDQTVNQLKDRGLVFNEPPPDQPWLWREAYLRDPSGKTICIYHAGTFRRHPPSRLKDEIV